MTSPTNRPTPTNDELAARLRGTFERAEARAAADPVTRELAMGALHNGVRWRLPAWSAFAVAVLAAVLVLAGVATWRVSSTPEPVGGSGAAPASVLPTGTPPWQPSGLPDAGPHDDLPGRVRGGGAGRGHHGRRGVPGLGLAARDRRVPILPEQGVRAAAARVVDSVYSPVAAHGSKRWRDPERLPGYGHDAAQRRARHGPARGRPRPHARPVVPRGELPAAARVRLRRIGGRRHSDRVAHQHAPPAGLGQAQAEAAARTWATTAIPGYRVVRSSIAGPYGAIVASGSDVAADRWVWAVTLATGAGSDASTYLVVVDYVTGEFLYATSPAP
jgi:hypothetical protein